MLLKEIYNSLTRRATGIAIIVFIIATISSLPVFAGGPPAPSSLSNSLALTLVTLMIILLIIIAMLGNLLVEIAGIRLKKEKAEKEKSKTAVATVLLPVFLLLSTGVMAQDEAKTSSVTSIGGLSPLAFYGMLTIIFVEMLVILVLLINIKFLLKKDVEKVYEVTPVKKRENFPGMVGKAQ